MKARNNMDLILNFGKSIYAKTRPGIRPDEEPDMMIRIPTTNELLEIPEIIKKLAT